MFIEVQIDCHMVGNEWTSVACRENARICVLIQLSVLVHKEEADSYNLLYIQLM